MTEVVIEATATDAPADSEADTPAPDSGPAPADQGQQAGPAPADVDTPPDTAPVVGAELAVPDPGAQLAEVVTPSVSELAVMMRQSELLAGSDIIPRAYRGSPANVLVAAMTGRSFGWDALTAMRNGHVIEGTWSMRPEAMVALVRKAGHRIEGETSATRAFVTGIRADDGTKISVEWTLEDAKRASLTGKDNWKHYPAAMLWARAVAQLCRMLFADVLLGVSYTPEELGADVNERGEVIEAQLAPGGDGWSSGQQSAGRSSRSQSSGRSSATGPSSAPKLASEETRAWLVEQTGALPDPYRTELREAWKGTAQLAGVKPEAMPKQHAARARGMVNAHWAKAVAAGVDRQAAVAAWQATQSAAETAQDAAETPAAPDTPATAPEGATADPGPASGGGGIPGGSINMEDVPSTDPPPALTDEEKRAVRADTIALLKMWAEEVRATQEDVPPGIADRIASDVGALHHSKVNAELAEGGLGVDLPPGSHIDARRMGVVVLRLQAFKDAGVTPGTGGE